MKSYVATTGTLFGLLTIVHIWRATQEKQLVTEPWYILITVAAAVLCVWALRVLRRLPKS